MIFTTIIFWMGRNHYVHIPATGKQAWNGKILLSAIKDFEMEKVFEGAKKDHPEDTVNDVKAAFAVGKFLS